MNLHHITKSIADLKKDTFIAQSELSALRQKIKVLVIDDNDFDYLDPLKACGFNLRKVDDISNIDDASAYDIILCDIMGVGASLDATLQGATVIKQIKLVYPDKRIIAYTASTYNPDFNASLNFADIVLTKGTASFDDWSDQLDIQIKKLVSPHEQWGVLCKKLLDAGVPTIEIAKIESSYVESFQARNKAPLEALINKQPDNVQQILQGFLSTTVAKLILMGLN